MRGNKTLMIIVVLLIIGVVVVGGLYLWMKGPGGAGKTQVTPEPTPTPIPTPEMEIVVAANAIPRGMLIRAEDNAITLQKWPQDSLPVEYYTSLEEVDRKFARIDIPRGMPVVPNMIAQVEGMLSTTGSAASYFAPDDRVAYAIPMDTQGAVAWALQPGDRVDVLAALSMTSVDPELVAESIKMFTVLIDTPDMQPQVGYYGHFESLPNGQYAGVTGLITNSFTSLVVQLTVQDAIVWHVGIWKEVESVKPEVPTAPVTPTTTTGGGGLLGGGGAAATVAAEPTPAPALVEYKDVEPVTLLVTREDALILKYLLEMGADLDLVLRPAGKTGTVIPTQPVWFRYLIDKYQLPSEMPTDVVAPVPLRQPLVVPTLATPTPQE
ncbi:MAG TPA: SAF domain-containing protein [Anaerolineae bacterium]|nr:SAF domain-containing protein [Anaerolineae bacterium]HQI84983.1 SAF domain-containing protein [Anaerolineae bacterium]